MGHTTLTLRSGLDQVKSWFNGTVKPILTTSFPEKNLIVHQQKDKAGEHWHVYDPMTQRGYDFSSDKEVLIWLDKRFYRN